MDAFARFAGGAASWKPGSLAAAYFETETAGVERLRLPDATLALVTLPFYAKYRKELGLTPRLRVVGESGAEEIWSLVAKRGAVTTPAALAGWDIVGVPAFSPEFVRGPILGPWGGLPDSARLVFSARVPSSLLKAAAGQKLAVLVDSAQADALPSHPAGAELEIVTRSKPLPASVLCEVGDRASSRAVEALVHALTTLADRAGSSEVLSSLRLRRFEPLDPKALDAALGADRRPPPHSP